jgi:hypothetical protein
MSHRMLLVPLLTITLLRHILSNVGRVAARDSSRATANSQDLFIALCEDSSIYGLFKNMKGKSLPITSHCLASLLLNAA